MTRLKSKLSDKILILNHKDKNLVNINDAVKIQVKFKSQGVRVSNPTYEGLNQYERRSFSHEDKRFNQVQLIS